MFSEQVKTESAAEEKAVLTPEVQDAATESTEGQAAEGQAAQPEQKQTMVPHGALHEERMRRKEAEQRASALEAQTAQNAREFALAQQRLAQALERVSQKPAEPAPDKTADPLGYAVHGIEQTQAQMQAIANQQFQRDQAEHQERQRQQQIAQQQTQMHQLRSLTEQGERAFSQAKPDYPEAVKFVREARAKQYAALGHSPEQAVQFVEQEGWRLCHESLMQGVNPAERVYALASTMGYQPKTVDEETKAKMQEAGQAAAKSSGGSSGKGKLTAAQIAQMTPTQLARLTDEQFAEAMG